MSLLWKLCVVSISLILLPPNLAGSSTEEEGSFRNNFCIGSKHLAPKCYQQCNGIHFRCFLNQCICLDTALSNEQSEDNNDNIKIMLDAVEELTGTLRSYLLGSNKQNEFEIIDSNEPEEVEINDQPFLRHHMAHFCPNLKVARACIRTCMKIAKPAFCGKDHKCYCGHRYTSMDVDVKLEPGDVNREFMEFYKKYFGNDPDNEYLKEALKLSEEPETVGEIDTMKLISAPDYMLLNGTSV